MSNFAFCHFVAAKTKIAPISSSKKQLTVPRLELAGCLILSELLKTIVEALKPTYPRLELFCWSDSYDCIHWINNQGKIREKYVQNRIEKIRKNLSGLKWLHCPGKLNPADMPTRGM